MKHLTIARLFIVLGAGALLADVAPTRCSKSTRTIPAVVAAEMPDTSNNSEDAGSSPRILASSLD